MEFLQTLKYVFYVLIGLFLAYTAFRLLSMAVFRSWWDTKYHYSGPKKGKENKHGNGSKSGNETSSLN